MGLALTSSETADESDLVQEIFRGIGDEVEDCIFLPDLSSHHNKSPFVELPGRQWNCGWRRNGSKPSVGIPCIPDPEPCHRWRILRAMLKNSPDFVQMQHRRKSWARAGAGTSCLPLPSRPKSYMSAGVYLKCSGVNPVRLSWRSADFNPTENISRG